MPKMTRAMFAELVGDLWMQTQQQFVKDRMVYGALIGLDAKGHNHMVVMEPEGVTRFADAGYLTVPGPYREHLDLIKAAFAEHKVVAAILNGEAWRTDNDYAVETLRTGIYPHEHPMATEMLFVSGTWPREGFTRAYQADIVRDKQGKEPPHLTRHTNIHDGDAGVAFTALRGGSPAL